jgi:hypothetical protein
MSESGRNLAIQIAVTALLIPIFTFSMTGLKAGARRVTVLTNVD